MLMLSDEEHETLRRMAYEQKVPMAKLIRMAIDQTYGTSDAEIQAPGRKPEKRN
jgi:hypothetical protein